MSKGKNKEEDQGEEKDPPTHTPIPHTKPDSLLLFYVFVISFNLHGRHLRHLHLADKENEVQKVQQLTQSHIGQGTEPGLSASDTPPLSWEPLSHR